MSKIHALEFQEGGVCRVILHTPMPTGSNIVGNSWKNVWIAAGRNITSMIEGTGIGEISTVEKALIIAGDVIEIDSVVPIEIVKQGAVAVNNYVDAVIASMKARYATEYDYYGWING